MGKRGPKPKSGEVQWSSELAYAVGLIATDGSLSKDGRHLDFTSKDKQQIKTFVHCLKLKRIKIGIKNKNATNEAYRVQWGDVQFYQFLLDIGLTPNKSRTLGVIDVPDKYFLDFLRGSFDGDGCFYSYFDKRWKSSFMYYLTFTSASPAHILWLRESIQRLLGVKGHVSERQEKSRKIHWVASLRYAKREALIVMRAMYHRPRHVCLARKKLKIKAALRIVGESLTRKP